MMENKKEELERVEVVNINYTQPRFWHRVMANFIDFFLLIVYFFSFFILTRSIVLNTPHYKQSEAKISAIQLASGLYVRDYANIENNISIISFNNKYIGIYGAEFNGQSADGGEPEGKIGKIIKAIDTFIVYCSDETVTPHDRYLDLVAYYDEMRLNTKTTDGVAYFVEKDNQIVPNETLTEDASNRKLFYENIYVRVVEDRFMPFLTSNVKAYSDAFRVQFNYLVFLELPVSFTIASILTYYVPPLVFKRGRKTIGKLIYHIGLVDEKRVLSPTFLRFTARFLILFFAELLLSFFTFGIPYIISFSMMAFSKGKQGFPDYMLRLHEVDTSKANIYLDYVEAELKNELHGEAIDFEMKKPL